MQKLNEILHWLIPSTILYFGAPHASAMASNYNICIEWRLQTVDSCDNSSCGIPSGPNAGGFEDYYTTCNSPGCDAIARGVRVKMARSGWTQTFDSGSDGCFSFSDTGTTYTMTVYGYATNDNGTFVRIHDDWTDFSSYPGSTYSAALSVTPTNNSTNTYNVGSYDRKWTTMAALGYGIYVWNDSLVGKEIHAGFDFTGCTGASAHYGSCSGASCNSNGDITVGRHYLQYDALLDATCSTPMAMWKFTIGHELGHAIAALWYGGKVGAVDGGEPGQDFTLATSPNSCGTGGTSYSMRSKEYNVLGFREGIAHFISGRIWNNKNVEAGFTWYEAFMHDMERWNFGAGTASGGRLENECNGSYTNAGVVEDWMRFFWDWYTNTDGSCTDQPIGQDLLELYAETRLNGGLTSSNYFSKMATAATGIGLPNCLATTRFDAYAAANGIDN